MLAAMMIFLVSFDYGYAAQIQVQERKDKSAIEEVYCMGLAFMQCRRSCAGAPCSQFCTVVCIFGSCPPMECSAINADECVPSTGSTNSVLPPAASANKN